MAFAMSGGDAHLLTPFDGSCQRAFVASLAALHRTSTSSAAIPLGLLGFRTIGSMRRALLCQGAIAWSAALPLLGEGIETTHVTSARHAYRCSVAAGLGHEASREVLNRKTADIVSIILSAAHRLANTSEGCKQLSITGLFLDLHEQPRKSIGRQLDESQAVLAGRIAKEATRLELRRRRHMTPAAALRTPVAVELVHAYDSAALKLASCGFCIIDGGLSLSDSRMLYDHFSGALHRGELFGPVSSDACNKGSFSLSIPIIVGAGPGPNNELIKQEVARHPSKAGAFAKACALRNALRVLIGLPSEIMDRLNAKCGSLVSSEVPPTVLCACYPPITGACYHRHKDWYPYETSNHRYLTVMLYLNPDWAEADGGELVVYNNSGILETILPIAGRMVVFFSRTIWHEVRPAKMRNRFAFTLWADSAELGPGSKRA